MTFCDVAARRPVVHGFQIHGKWTPEEIARCREFYDAGRSFGQIAAEFGVSRNSIAGLINRQGFPPRAEVRVNQNGFRKERKPKAPRPQRVAQIKPPLVIVPDVVDLEIPKEQRRTLLQLTAHTCRFGIGDVGDVGFFFCGAEPKEGSAYCAGHHRRCVSVC